MHSLLRFRALLDPDEQKQLEASIRRPLSPALRINTLKISVEAAQATWPQWYGWQVEPVPFCETGWQIRGGGEHPSRTIEHRTGRFYIQDAASMLPAEMFHYEIARPLILDMAASPGGKTTHLACKIGDAGVIIANDASASRIGALRSNVRKWGAIGAAITNLPGERFGNWFPEVFDMVLLDAPCSGESLRTAERRKTSPVTAAEREQLHQRQVRLLASALRAVKPGGQVVYATCTLAPEEDEAVVDALLKMHPRAVEVESLEHRLPVAAPGLAANGARRYDGQVQRAIRLWPHRYDTSGFFAALIRKRDMVPIHPHEPPARSLADAGFERLLQPAQARIERQTFDDYGLDLAEIVERQRLTLWKRRRSVHAIPESYVKHFEDMPSTAAGMLIGEDVEGFVPSHEFASRFSSRFTRRRFRLDPEHAVKWLAGYDLRGLDTSPHAPGAVILVEDERGRFAGRGKVLGDRLRNLLPKM